MFISVFSKQWLLHESAFESHVRREFAMLLREHDAKVREPLVNGLNRLMPLVDVKCMPQARRAYDAALAEVKEE